MTVRRTALLLLVLLPAFIGCTENPVQQPAVDTRATFFPIVDGAEWHYVDQHGEPLTPVYIDANTGATNFGFAFPARIFASKNVGVNPAGSLADEIDATQIVAMSYLMPTTESLAIGMAATGDEVRCFVQNVHDKSVWVPYGPDNALPLRPTIGQKVRVLDGAEYMGVGIVETPAYSGAAHRFLVVDQWGTSEYWFADGVGFVAFYGRRGSAIDVFTIELASYTIPE
jgi:hypothetical protein